jgi:hypothetical protein
MKNARSFAGAATLLTPLLGIGYLLQADFLWTRCFRSGTLSGCENIHGDVAHMLAVAPLALVLPFGMVLFATGLAGAAWHAMRAPVIDGTRVAALVATYGIAFVPVTLRIGPVFITPFLCLLASMLMVSGAKPAVVARELIKGTVVVLGAFSAALAALALWGARFGGPGTGGAEWLYVGIATALGIAAGCLAAAAAHDPRQVLRYVVLSYGGFGLGALATAIALFPVFYPDGRYVNLGISSLWRFGATLILANTVAGLLTLRVGGRLPWWVAIGGTCAAGLGFVLAFLATVAIPGGGELMPPVPLLPNTSTTD